MEPGNKNISPALHQALLRYNARFPLPPGFIAGTMLEISRRTERRAYIRGLVIISAVSLLMIVAALVMLRISGVTFTMSAPISGLTSISSTISDTATAVGDVISSPLTIMPAVSAAVLLLLDRLLRRRIAMRHPL